MTLMTQAEVLDVFRAAEALLEGHFILSSGKRSSLYLQCAKVLQSPERAARLCAAVAAKLKSADLPEIDLVVSPAMGGVIVGYEMGRQLGTDAIFMERVEGTLALRRGFEIPEGAKILMMEDVVTTGLSSRECIEGIENLGGTVVAAGCLINRSGGRANLDVPLISLAEVDAPLYDPADVPADLAATAAIKPGSRGLKA